MVSAARKRLRRKGAKDRLEAGKMKVQVAAPWKRWVLALVSFVWLGIAAFLFRDSPGASAVFFVLFVLTGLLALFGRKKTIDEALNGLDTSISDRVFESIVEGLF